MLDQEKKPSVGYIYEAMDRAKEAIANSFTTEEHYKKAFEYIDERWNCQLHRPLHAAGYFLNPELHYDNPDVSGCEEVMKGFLDCLTRLVPKLDLQKISFELDAYRNASSLFGLPIAVRQRKTKPPAEWWFTYGCSTPNLQKFAMRVLSLTCSAIGCERNWDGFQILHTNKKNKLAQGRLNDLVFVKFNHALQCRYNRKDAAKSNLLEEIDDVMSGYLGKWMRTLVPMKIILCLMVIIQIGVQLVELSELVILAMSLRHQGWLGMAPSPPHLKLIEERSC